MLSHTELTKKGTGGSRAAADYLFASEYYLGAEGEQLSRVVWLGEGAKALGLEPGTEADAATLSNLLEGFTPDGETKLTQNAGSDKRRLGHDLTFSADKSVSILFAGTTPEEREQMLAIHHRAAEAAIGYLQGEIKARRGHAGESSVAVEGLVMARVDHFSSRELQAQLHSHYCIANLALGADGRFSTFDAEAFESMKHPAGALYRAEMAAGLKQMGYNIESTREMDSAGRETGQVWHRVAGIEQETLNHFSERRQQILAYQELHGVSAQVACMETRQAKDGGEPDAARIMEETARELDELRNAGVVQWANVQELRQADGLALEARTDAQILERLHAHESGWGRGRLVDALAKEKGGVMDAAQVLAEADAFLQRNALLELTPDQQGRPRWASQAQHDLEQGIADRAIARADDLSVRVAPDFVTQAIADHEAEKGFTLTEEQAQSVRFATQDTGGVACLTGRAGTGKTATAGAMIKAFEANGQRVIGTSSAWDAAGKLAEETGLETYSTAALLWQLDSKKLTLTNRDVVLVDEAGMVGAKTIASLQKHIDQAGGKLVMMGDALQLQPVEAGAPFRLAQEAVGHSALTEIRRQKDEQDRELANAFYGNATGADIVGKLIERKQLKEYADSDDAKKGLVSKYLADPTPAREKLVIAPTNDSVRALTGEIRRGLKEQGQLQNAVDVQVRGALKDEKKTLELAVGDRVRFGIRDKKMGVANGTLGIVEKIDDAQGGHRLGVRLESEQKHQDGRLVEVDTKRYQALEHGYAGTVHKSQGQGKKSVYWLADGGNTDRHLGLVAFTRTKDNLQAFTTARGAERLEKGLDSWRMKQNAGEMLAAKEVVPVITNEQTATLGKALGDYIKERKATLLQTPQSMDHKAAIAEQNKPDTSEQEQKAKQAKEQKAERERVRVQEQKAERHEAAKRLALIRQNLNPARENARKAEQLRDVAQAGLELSQTMKTAQLSSKVAYQSTIRAAQHKVDAWHKEHSYKSALGFKPPTELTTTIADATTKVDECRKALKKLEPRIVDGQKLANNAEIHHAQCKKDLDHKEQVFAQAKGESAQMKQRHDKANMHNWSPERLEQEMQRIKAERAKLTAEMDRNGGNAAAVGNPSIELGQQVQARREQQQAEAQVHKRSSGYGMSM